MKRRIGTTGAATPIPLYIEQLDDYLLQSQSMGKGVRMGILTDGKHWLLRWPNAVQPGRSIPTPSPLRTAMGGWDCLNG